MMAMISLQDFVAETLAQIADGVIDAQRRTTSTGAVINPNGLYLGEHVAKSSMVSPTQQPAANVEFDVAITAEQRQGGDNKASVGVVSATISGDPERRESAVSRVRFSVPVLLPPGANLEERRARR